MKIILNQCYGWFGLSHAAVLQYAELAGINLLIEKDAYGDYTYKTSPDEYFATCDIDRTDPNLVKVVENLGTAAGDRHSRPVIVDIPTGTRYYCHEYNGWEFIMTDDTIAWKVAT